MSVNYEDNVVIESKLHEQSNTQYLSYTKVHWSVHIRKEVINSFSDLISSSFLKIPYILDIFFKVFSPNEKLNTPLAIELIFMQIVRDFTSTCCIRISDKDRLKLNEFLGILKPTNRLD